MSAHRKGVALLGATGSIGLNALDVIGRFPERFRVTALCAGRNARSLVELACRFRPAILCLSEPVGRSELAGLPSRTRVVFGEAGMHEAVSANGTDIVLAAASGVSSIRPVIAAAAAGKRIALANKELLVMAGGFLVEAARAGGGELLPVDSEHSAIYQVFDFARPESVAKLILTASGGPFRSKDRAFMATATREQAVAHPTWDMGAKISVDSATLMNKGLELIEAHFLFDVPEERIDVLVHPQSVIHSLVEYVDGSVLAQLGTPDMRTPIAYAMGWPKRIAAPSPRLDLAAIGSLTFERPDYERFPALRLAREALEAGGSAPTVLNAANEVAVLAFLDRQIGFLDIAKIVGETLDRIPRVDIEALEVVAEIDLKARAIARETIARNRVIN
jgi:1-deoxy-D-xylulose-5-phosphate reductoisomerase